VNPLDHILKGLKLIEYIIKVRDVGSERVSDGLRIVPTGPG
jgi:hypothetical protein